MPYIVAPLLLTEVVHAYVQDIASSGVTKQMHIAVTSFSRFPAQFLLSCHLSKEMQL
jgi:hypothetical protein